MPGNPCLKQMDLLGLTSLPQLTRPQPHGLSLGYIRLINLSRCIGCERNDSLDVSVVKRRAQHQVREWDGRRLPMNTALVPLSVISLSQPLKVEELAAVGLELA